MDHRGLGFVLGGPMGALVGFAIGSLIDGASGLTEYAETQRRPHTNTQEEISRWACWWWLPVWWKRMEVQRKPNWPLWNDFWLLTLVKRVRWKDYRFWRNFCNKTSMNRLYHADKPVHELLIETGTAAPAIWYCLCRWRRKSVRT